MNDTTAPRRPSRKQDILDAALACFTEHGVEATTIDMIRERSGASVGSMYHHFGSKESIAAALYIDALADYGRLQAARLAAARSARDGIVAVVHAYVDWIADNPDKARFVLYGRGAIVRSEAGAELKARTQNHVPDTLNWFAPYIARGELRALPRDVLPSLVTGPAHDYARLWLSGRAQTDIRAYRDLFAETAWKSVCP